MGDLNGVGSVLTENLVLDTSLSDAFDQIYELNLRNKGISKIENLAKCQRLRSLDLSCNNIKKIENLETCEDLKELKLFHNSISKIDSLYKNSQLQTLLLHSNKITTIEEKTMKNLVKLTTLRLDYNNILKIDGLMHCRNLTYLDLSNNKISRMEGLDTLVNLEDLYLGDNNLSVIDNLSRCSKLREIRFSNNRISSGSGIPKTLTQLSILRLDHNIFPQLAFPSSKCLTELFLQYNELCSLAIPKTDKKSRSTIVDMFPYLEILDVSYNRITDLESVFALADLSELVELVLTGNPICSAPNYPFCVWAKLPQLQLLDGIPRNPTIDYANTVPTDILKFLVTNWFKIIFYLFPDIPTRPSTATRQSPSPYSISPSPPSSSRPSSSLNPSISFSRPSTSSSRPSTSSSLSPSPSPSLTPLSHNSPTSLSPSSSYSLSTSNSTTTATYSATAPYFNAPSSYAAFASTRPTTPYSARPASSASTRPSSALSRPASSASLRNAVDPGHVPLMAPVSSMSKVHRMPSLHEVEQQFSNFKTQLETMSSDVLQRTKYIRDVVNHPNTLGKEFVNQTPRETLSPSSSSSLPKTNSYKKTSSRTKNENGSDSDNDSEVRAVMERDRKEMDETEVEIETEKEKGKLKRTDSMETEKKVNREKLRSREGQKEKTTEIGKEEKRDTERERGKETKERKIRTSSPNQAPSSPTPVSPSSPSLVSSRKKKSDQDPSKLQTRTSDSPKKQHHPKTETPPPSYVPSDIHSFVSSVLNKESDDEDYDQADYEASFSSLPKSESSSELKSTKKAQPTKASSEVSKPEAAIPKRTKSTKPQEKAVYKQDQLTNEYESTSIKSKEIPPTFEKSSQSKPTVPPPNLEAPVTIVPKLTIPKLEPENGPVTKKFTSARSQRGPVGPVFDEPDTFDDEDFEGHPTDREVIGYKSFRTPRGSSTPSNNTTPINNTPNNRNNNRKIKIALDDDDESWNMHSIIT